MWMSVYSGGSTSPRAAPQTAYRLPSPLFPKTSQPFTLSLKIKISGGLTAPLEPINSGSVAAAADGAYQQQG